MRMDEESSVVQTDKRRYVQIRKNLPSHTWLFAMAELKESSATFAGVCVCGGGGECHFTCYSFSYSQ